MRRALGLLVALLLCTCVPQHAGANSLDLSAEMLAAFGGETWAGYTPYHSAPTFGGDTAATAVVMAREGQTILCIIEPVPGQAAWAVTACSDSAYPDGIPMDVDNRADVGSDGMGGFYLDFRPLRRKEGVYTLHMTKNAGGAWEVSGFSWASAYSGVGAMLGKNSQFGMHYEQHTPGTLQCHAAPQGQYTLAEVVRQELSRDRLGLSFLLSEFDLDAYIRTLLGLFVAPETADAALAYAATTEDMARDAYAAYEENGSIYTLFDAWRWEHGYFYDWSTETWAAFAQTFAAPLAALAQQDTYYRDSELYKLAANGYRLPETGELSREAAVAAARHAVIEEGLLAEADLDAMQTRAVLIGSPPDGNRPVWKVAFLSADGLYGAMVQLLADSGALHDISPWDGTFFARHLPFAYMEPGKTAADLADWQAFADQ